MRLNNNTSQDTEFNPPPFDENAKIGVPTQTGEYYEELDIQIKEGICKIALESKPIANDSNLSINLTSSAENQVWFRIVLYDKSMEVMGESGIIRPGEYLENVKLNKPTASGDELKIKLLTYEPDTYLSKGAANLNLKIK